MPLFNSLRELYYDYEMPLAAAMHAIEKRGLLVDTIQLSYFRGKVDGAISTTLADIENLVKKKCIVGKEDAKLNPDAFNINSPKQVMDMLRSVGLKIPKNRVTGKETTQEDELFKLFGETGNDVLRHILTIRELVKVKGTYINAKLLDSVLYCEYVVSGTVTGRRSSRQSYLGIGTNHQNFPKHSKLGKEYRSCIIARPGKVFVSCDQKGADDWVVQAIIADQSGITTGIDELRAGVNRHRKLAAFLFAKPEAAIDKGEYYLGKKTRHSGNYGVHGPTMSASMAQQGVAMEPKVCDYFLSKFHEFEPAIKGVFHPYIERELCTKKQLTTPVGRSRYFLNLRSYGNNNATFRDGYIYIPQSVVGDNTGLAILYLETNWPGQVVSDNHDAIILEVDDNPNEVKMAFRRLGLAFQRTFVFPNGFSIEIPQEYEVGYSLGTMETCPDNLDEAGLSRILERLRPPQKHRSLSTSGVPLPS